MTIKLPAAGATSVKVLSHVDCKIAALVFCCVSLFGNYDWVQNIWPVLGNAKSAF